MFPSAQKLILDVLTLNQPYPCKVRHLIQFGDCFEINENTIRVTLARLVKSQMILSEQRGFYRIAPSALCMQQQLWQWRTLEPITKPWQGDYIMISCHDIGRTDRIALHKREKALSLLGFTSLEKDLYLRPDNLIYTHAEIKQKLIALGMDPRGRVFMASDFECSHEEMIGQLWQPERLNAGYLEQEQRMRHWMFHQHSYPAKQAVQESYVLCQRAIRSIFFDPLLPEPYVNSAYRERFMTTTRHFEINGIAIWRDFCHLEPSGIYQPLKRPFVGMRYFG